MNGWVMLALIGVLAGALLWLLRFPARLWTLAGTALMLGAAGYAWQGRPGLPDSPAETGAAPAQIDENLVRIREAMFGRFGTYAALQFGTADAMLRGGRPDLAAAVMLAATREAPAEPGPWVGLGLAIAERDGNNVSPAARLAFDRAMQAAPRHPGPPFFLGLAYVRAGEFAKARPWWARAVALTPADASYRDDLVVRLFLLDKLLQGAPGAAQQPVR